MKRGVYPRIRQRHKRRENGNQREEGQSLLEMAFTFPILLLLVLAVVDFGRAFDAMIVLTNAVREGARYGSRVDDMTVGEIQDLVVEDVLGSGTNITNMPDFEASHVTVDRDTSFVRVTVHYDFPLWFGGLIGLDTVELHKEAVMPIMAAMASP